MKLAITIDLYIEGIPVDLQPLSHTYEDDVDGEGPMVAKYWEPLMDGAMLDDPVWFGNLLILRPENIIAAHYTVGELGVDMVSADTETDVHAAPAAETLGGNQGAHWRNKTINGINCSTYDIPSPDQLRPTLDITIVSEVIVRRYSLQPLDLPPKPGAKARLWRGRP